MEDETQRESEDFLRYQGILISQYLKREEIYDDFMRALNSRFEDRYWCERYDLDRNLRDPLRGTRGKIAFFREAYPEDSEEIEEIVREFIKKERGLAGKLLD